MSLTARTMFDRKKYKGMMNHASKFLTRFLLKLLKEFILITIYILQKYKRFSFSFGIHRGSLKLANIIFIKFRFLITTTLTCTSFCFLNIIKRKPMCKLYFNIINLTIKIICSVSCKKTCLNSLYYFIKFLFGLLLCKKLIYIFIIIENDQLKFNFCIFFLIQ